MDNKKKQKDSFSSSSSSITSQLFGSPELDVLASIFPPNKGEGRSSGYPEMRGSWKKAPSTPRNHPFNSKHGGNSTGSKDRSSIYQQEGAEPSYLSSSLYYGGQETYSRSSTTHHTSSYSYPKFKKDDDEDDVSGAARGNWWQGSLYY